MRRIIFMLFFLIFAAFPIFSTARAEEGKLIPMTVGDIERYKNLAPKERVFFIKNFYLRNKDNGIDDETILNELLKLVKIDKDVAEEIKRRYNKLITYYNNFIKAVQDQVDEMNASILEHYPGRTDRLIDLGDNTTWDNIKYVHINNVSIADAIKVFNSNSYFSERSLTNGLSAELASCANMGEEEIYMSFLFFLEKGLFLKTQEEGGISDGIRIDFSGSENVIINPIHFPMESVMKVNGKTVLGYEKKAYLPFTIKLQDKEKQGSIKALPTVNICSESGCRTEVLKQITYKTEDAVFEASFCQNIKNEFNRMPESGKAKVELTKAFFQKASDGQTDLILSLQTNAFEGKNLEYLIKNEQGLLFSAPFLIEDGNSLIIKSRVLNPEKLTEQADIVLDVSYPNAGKRFKITPSFEKSNVRNLSLFSFSFIDVIKSFIAGLQIFSFTPVLAAFLMLLYQALVDRQRHSDKTVDMYYGLAKSFGFGIVTLLVLFVCSRFYPVFTWGRQFDFPFLDFIFINVFIWTALHWKKLFDDVFVELTSRRGSFVFSIFQLDETKEKAGFMIGLLTGALLLITPTTYLYYGAYNIIIRSVVVNSAAFAIGLFFPFFLLFVTAEGLDKMESNKSVAWIMNKIIPLIFYIQAAILLSSIGFLAGKNVLIGTGLLLLSFELLIFRQNHIVNKALLIISIIGAFFIPYRANENSQSGIWSVPFDEAALHRQVDDGKAVYLNVSEDFCFLCVWNRFVVRYQGMPEQVKNGDLIIMRIKSDDPFLKQMMSESPYLSLPMNFVFSPKYPKGKVVDAVFGLWSSESVLNQAYPQPVKVVGPSHEKLLEEMKLKHKEKDTN